MNKEKNHVRFTLAEIAVLLPNVILTALLIFAVL